jgi:hypothetical protein
MEKIGEYRDHMKSKQFYAAASTLRLCVWATDDPKIKALFRDAEIRNYRSEIDDSKAPAVRRAEALEKFASEYPEEAKKYTAQLDQLRSQAAVQEAEMKRSTSMATSNAASQAALQEAAVKRRQGVSIGMSKDDVLASSWGKPRSVNRTVTASGVHEQWVYRGGYLYFEDGVLTAIQN